MYSVDCPHCGEMQTIAESSVESAICTHCYRSFQLTRGRNRARDEALVVASRAGRDHQRQFGEIPEVEVQEAKRQIDDTVKKMMGNICRCEACGSSAPTREVTFGRNIGAILVMFPKTITGKLCKKCIRSYFWSYSLTSLALGWWGIISVFYNPVCLVNNLIQYLACRDLPETFDKALELARDGAPLNQAKRTRWGYAIAGWVMLILGCLMFGILLLGAFAPPPPDKAGQELGLATIIVGLSCPLMVFVFPGGYLLYKSRCQLRLARQP